MDKKIILHPVETPFDIHTEVQNGYLIDYLPEAEVYINGQKETSKPAVLYVSWDTEGKFPKDTTYIVTLSSGNDSIPKVKVSTKEKNAEITNLYLHTHYSLVVEAALPDEKIISNTVSFDTSSRGPRFIDIDGVTNVRDQGGWKVPGGYVKQGILYRGAVPFNEGHGITEKGLDTALKSLRIKTEIDIRDNKEVDDKSLFGESVKYINVPMTKYTPSTAGEKAKMFFETISDSSIYPAYYHCHMGSDRTGFISFLLLALLGVEQYDFMRDYSSTNLSLCEWPRNRSEMVSNTDAIMEYPGDTLSEKTANYLISVGVTTETIKKIKDIFIEK